MTKQFNKGTGRTLFRWYLLSAGALLFATGAAKLVAVTGEAKILGISDPIFGIQFRYLLFAASLTEMIVAYLAVFVSNSAVGIKSVAWLSTLLALYRFGMWWVGWRSPCGCLGNMADALHIAPQEADVIMKCVLAYLLIGSYCGTAWAWRQPRAQELPVSPQDGAAAGN